MEELTINRQGNFSCPVSTGVIFVTNLDAPDTPASAFEEAAQHFAVRRPALLTLECPPSSGHSMPMQTKT